MEVARYSSLPKALRRSRVEIIAEYNISPANFTYWQHHPKVLNAKKRLTKLWFQDDVPDVLMALRQKSLAGDVNAQRLFLEYVDQHTDINIDPMKMNKQQIFITIKELHQKFYGKKSE